MQNVTQNVTEKFTFGKLLYSSVRVQVQGRNCSFVKSKLCVLLPYFTVLIKHLAAYFLNNR